MKHFSLTTHLIKVEYNNIFTVTAPLLFFKDKFINTEPQKIISRFSKFLTDNYSKEGNYSGYIPLMNKIDLKTDFVVVKISKSSNNYSFPDTEFIFDFLYYELDGKLFFAIVPVLDIETIATDFNELKDCIVQNILIEFNFNKRLFSARMLLDTQLSTFLEYKSFEIDFPVYTQHEQIQEHNETEEKWLPKVTVNFEHTEESVFCLDNELNEFYNICKSRFKRSILIYGESGTGKTALMQEIARRKDFFLDNRKILKTNASKLIQELTAGNGWQYNLAKVCKELLENSSLLYIERFSELFEVGQYSGNNTSMAEYLIDYINRGEIQIVSEITPSDFDYVNTAFSGYISDFHVIKIQHQSKQRIIDIVNKKLEFFSRKYQVSYSLEILTENLSLLNRFSPYSGYPGKAIMFLENIFQRHAGKNLIINNKIIYHNFCLESGIPEFLINPDLKMETQNLRAYFESNIFGQQQALEFIFDILISVKAELVKSGKPLASLMFVGPTGVGKTETAKVLANYMFGDKRRLIRFDMSEYAGLDAIMRLTGDLRGDEGLLTSLVRQNPFIVILFDEVEKAHPAFFDLLLQITGEGRLTDANGRTADFCSSIIILTSNIGASNFQISNFGYIPKEYSAVSNEHFFKEIKKYFRPELINRFDKIIPFSPLSKDLMKKLLFREISIIEKRNGLLDNNLKINLSDDLIEDIVNEGYHPLFGARHLQRVIHSKIITEIAFALQKNSDNLAKNVFLSKNEVTFIDQKQKRKHENTENLNKIGDEILQLRRKIFKIKKSGYLRLVNSIHELTDQIQKIKQSKKSNYQLNILQKIESDLISKEKLKLNFDELFSFVTDYETNTLSNLLHLQSIKGNDVLFLEIKSNLKNIENKSVDLQLNLYTELYTEMNYCNVLFFGNQRVLDEAFIIYNEIIKSKKIECNYYYVFYDVNINNTDILQYKIEKYTLIDAKTSEAEKLKDSRIGFVAELNAPGVALFFNSEPGFHRYEFKSAADNDLFFIELSNLPVKNTVIPINVNTKQFFNSKQIVRKYKNGMYYDDKKELLTIRSLINNLHGMFLENIYKSLTL